MPIKIQFLRPRGYVIWVSLVYFILLSAVSFAQVSPSTHQSSFVSNIEQTLHASNDFIENKGQYGNYYTGHENMGKILYGYEGLSMPVLFTPHGLIHLQRTIKDLPHDEKEKLEKKGIPEEEIEQQRKIIDQAITMEWIGANPSPQVICSGKSAHYFT